MGETDEAVFTFWAHNTLPNITMLVQTCPATTNTLGSYSGPAQYCGLNVPPQNDSSYAVPNNVINDRISIPIVMENTEVTENSEGTGVRSDANGNTEVIETNKCVPHHFAVHPTREVNNSDIFDGNSDKEAETDSRFLKIETDTLETESQMINFETTITETFVINSNEIVDDIISELIDELILEILILNSPTAHQNKKSVLGI